MNIYYSPIIDDEEIKIFEDVFGKDKLKIDKYRTKSFSAGAFDIQIIIDTLNDPTITAILHGVEFASLLTILVKRLFGRNTKNIMDNNSRPRYTTLTIRMETNWVVISNVNSKNNILISNISSDFDEIKKQHDKGDVEFTEQILKDYLR